MNVIEARWKRAALVACLIVCGSAGAAGAATPPVPEALMLSALIGPESTKLFIDAPAGVTTFEHVRVEIRAPEASDEQPTRIINLTDVAAPEGLATVDLGTARRGAAVSVDVHIREQDPPRTVIRGGDTIVKLRPDLAVTAVFAPPQTLTTRAIDVVVDISELNLETAATATLKLMLGPTPIAEPKTVTVASGGSLSVAFTGVQLTTPISAELTAVIDGAAPFEIDTTNNTGTTDVEVTEHELAPSTVLFPSLGGYGAQFNNHLYAPITQPWMTPGAYADVEEKVKELQPQLVRIFYNDNWEENADRTHPEWAENYSSFVEVVRLAHETGATIDISYQSLGNIVRRDGDPLKRTPADAMARFADALEDLVKNHRLTNVRWATVGNEPNAGQVTLEQIYALNRALHAELVRRGLDGQIKLMGGGLVENAGNPARNHYVWMKAIAENLGDIIEGYAEHVYWNYDDPGRLEYRLRDTYNLMNNVLPEALRKPTYMMEFGARGYLTCGTKPALRDRYYRDADCTEIWRTNIVAFQQLWFAIGSAQLGVAGAAKWDAYWAIYDRFSINQQVYWMTGPPWEGYPLLPTYNAMSLLFHVTAPGWQILRVGPWDESDWSVPAYEVEGHSSNDVPEKELVGYAGPDGELTIVGLDTNGRSLNAASDEPAPTYSIGGLPPNTTLNLALWNAAGDGKNSLAETVDTGPAGVARFEVPLHAAFALTTVAAS